MKEQILKLLKTKFEGVSDAILGRVTEKLAKTTTKEEDIQTAIDGVTFQSILDSYSDHRVTEATGSAISNYEKKYNIKEGKEIKKPEGIPEPQNDDKTPEWAKALIKANETLADKVTSLEGDQVIKSRQKQLAEAITKAPDQYKARIEKDFSRMSFETDEDFTGWAVDVKAESDKLAEEAAARGSVFGTPKGGRKVNPDEVPQEMLDHFDDKSDDKKQDF